VKGDIYVREVNINITYPQRIIIEHSAYLGKEFPHDLLISIKTKRNHFK